jgi:hypothetical protein
MDQRTLNVRKNHSSVLRTLKRTDEARAEMLEALEDERQLYDAPHRAIAYSLGNLGNFDMDQQRFDGCVSYWQQAQNEAVAALGESHPWIIQAELAAARCQALGGRIWALVAQTWPLWSFWLALLALLPLLMLALSLDAGRERPKPA